MSSLSSFLGTFLTCRTSEVKPRHVTFEPREIEKETIDLGSANDTASASSDNVTISDRVIKLGNPISIMKYDNVTQQKVKKVYRIGVIADSTGAVQVMLWEEIGNQVSFLFQCFWIDVFLFSSCTDS